MLVHEHASATGKRPSITTDNNPCFLATNAGDTEFIVAKFQETLCTVQQSHYPTKEAKRIAFQKAFNDLLFHYYPTIQWEIMPRDLSRAINERVLKQVPITSDLGISGLISEDNHKDKAMKEWLACAESDLLAPFYQYEIEKCLTNLSAKFDETLFDISDADATTLYNIFISRMAYELQSEVGTLEEHRSHAVIIPDGEITFFCALWLLRVARCREGLPILDNWLVGSHSKVELAIDYNPSSFSESNWDKVTKSTLLFRMGLLCPAEGNEQTYWHLSARGRSFFNWLVEIRRRIEAATNDNDNSGLKIAIEEFKKNTTEADSSHISQILPLVRVIAGLMPFKVPPPRKDQAAKYTDRCGELLVRLFYLFLSPVMSKEYSRIPQRSNYEDPGQFLSEILAPLRDVKVNQIVAGVLPQFQPLLNRAFKELLAIDLCGKGSALDWILTANFQCQQRAINPDPVPHSCQHCDCSGVDMGLFEIARTCILPVEYVLRKAQPYPITLLVIPFDYDRVSESETTIFNGLEAINTYLVPSAIAFASIMGTDPAMNQRIYSHSEVTNNRHWHSYWNLFSGLSSAILSKYYGGIIRDLAYQKANDEYSFRLGHEMRRIIDAIQPERKPYVYDYIRQYMYAICMDDSTAIDQREYLPEDYFKNDPEGLDLMILRAFHHIHYQKKFMPILKNKKDWKYDSFEQFTRSIDNPKSPFSFAQSILGRPPIPSLPDDQLLVRTAFFGALVALLYNTIEHLHKDGVIQVSSIGSAIEFRNYRGSNHRPTRGGPKMR